MSSKTIGEICNILSGYAFDSKLFTNDFQDTPLIRIRDVVRGYTNTYSKENYEDKYIVKKGDLLIGMDGEFNIAPWKSEDALLNQRVCKIWCSSNDVTEKYLLYFLPKALKDIERETSFVTVKHLSVNTINKIQIPLPPIETQKQIAKTLDTAAELLAMRKQQLAEWDNLIKSTFYDMFGEYNANKSCYRLLPEVCNFIDYRGKTPEKSDRGVPLITAKNVKNNAFFIEPREYIPSDTYDAVMTRGFPKINDVIFTTEAPLGNVCRIPNLFDKFAVGQRIIVMQPLENTVTSEYLEFALTTDEFQRDMLKRSSGSTVRGIRSKELVQLSIPVPPISLQNQFSEIVTKIEEQKALVKKAIDETQYLFDSLMSEYFETN